MPIHVSTYSGGMDRDSSKNKYQPNSYYLLKNMRITSFDELSNGVIQSIKGNTKVVDISFNTNYAGFYDNDAIIGHCIIREWLVFWSTDNTTTGGRGTIWKVNLSSSSPTYIKVYEHADMNLTSAFPIYDESIGYYESADIIKIYWTDSYNMIRFVNIADISIYDETTSTASMDVSMLNILPDVSLNQPEVINIGGGNINVGKIQYAYQYYNIGGVETVFSQCNPLIHLTQMSEGLSGGEVRTYQGSPSLDASGNPNNAGKSVTIQINNVDTDYEKIRIVALLYRNLNQEPEIHVVGEYDVFEGIIVTDYGNYSKGTISLNAFRTLGNHELYCKTIAQKGNKMLIGNIREKFFDITDYDTRAYRYGPKVGTLNATHPISVTETQLDDINCTLSNLAFDYPVPVDIQGRADYNLVSGIVSSIDLSYSETVTDSDSIVNDTLTNGYVLMSQKRAIYNSATDVNGIPQVVVGSTTVDTLAFQLPIQPVFNNYPNYYLVNSGVVSNIRLSYTETVNQLVLGSDLSLLYKKTVTTQPIVNTTTDKSWILSDEYLFTYIKGGGSNTISVITADPYGGMSSRIYLEINDFVNKISSSLNLSTGGTVIPIATTSTTTVSGDTTINTITSTDVNSIRISPTNPICDISGYYRTLVPGFESLDQVGTDIPSGSNVSDTYQLNIDHENYRSYFPQPIDLSYNPIEAPGFEQASLRIRFEYEQTIIVTTTIASYVVPGNDDFFIEKYSDNDTAIITISNFKQFLITKYNLAPNIVLVTGSLINATMYISGYYRNVIAGSNAGFSDQAAIVSASGYDSNTDQYSFVLTNSSALTTDWFSDNYAEVLEASIICSFSYTHTQDVTYNRWNNFSLTDFTYATTSLATNTPIWNFTLLSNTGNLFPTYNPFDANRVVVQELTLSYYLRYHTYYPALAEYTWLRSTDKKVRISITNFKTKTGIDPLRTISNIAAVAPDFSCTYNQTATYRVSVVDLNSVPSNYNYNPITDLLEFDLDAAGGGDYFTDFVSYDYVGYLETAFTYDYDVPATYTFTDNTKTNFELTLPTNVTPWQFNLKKDYGNFFDPENSVNWNSLIISATISCVYSYTDINGKRIIVYNSKTAQEDEIKSDVDFNAWPNTSYTMIDPITSIYEDVPLEHDCINPYNYDFLYGEKLGIITPKIDEVATYCTIDDLAINPSTGESNNSNQFKYQSGLTTLGGEGPNIKYEFVTTAMIIEDGATAETRYDDPSSVTIGNLTSYDSYKNPLRSATITGNKRDEVYRYALVATNTKGQDSFAYWIADIKFPTVTEYPLTYSFGRLTTAYSLGVKFTINTAPLVAQGVVGIRIVRVERKENDRSIYSQGTISNMFLDNYLPSARFSAFPRITLKTPPIGTGVSYTLQQNLLQFISPEVNYFKNLEPKNTDYIKYQARLGGLSAPLSYGRYIYYTYDPNNAAADMDDDASIEVAFIAGNYNKPLVSFNRYKNTSPLTGNLYTYTVSEGMIAGIVEHGGEDENYITFTFSTTPVLNRAIDYNGASMNHEGPSGTCAILILGGTPDKSELINAIDYFETYLVDYKKAGVGASQYNGLSYEARQTNTYVECGDYFAITGASDVSNVYGGDTFIGFFEHLKTIYEADDNEITGSYDIPHTKRICSIEAFPVESVINLDLAHGAKFSKDYLNDSIHAIRESKGTYHADHITTGAFPTSYPVLIQEEDMYLYNSVYSQANSSKVYFTKPSNWLDEIHEDTLVKISEEKVPREDIDSFVKFLTDNEKVLPTQYGPVTDLFLFKNYMITFFERAFGSLSIDERALLPIQNNTILELGAANNLQFFDFISNRSGSIHPQSIDYCGDGFVWFDATLGSLGYYNGQTQDIGLVKGMSSPLKNFSEFIKAPTGTYYSNQFAGGNILCYENMKYKETLCSFILSEMVSCSTVTATTLTFTLLHSPVTTTIYDTVVIIDGIEYIAHSVTGTNGIGVLTINITDNPSYSQNNWAVGRRYFVFYKDLSTTYSFSSIINSFMYEIEMFPTWLLEYGDDLYTMFGKFNIYKENYGNYGEFYGIYRKGEIEYLINPKASHVCVFNNYEYAMEAYDSDNIDMPNETWTSIEMKNDYQYTASNPIACQITSGGTNAVSLNPSGLHNLINGDRIMFSGVSLPSNLDNTIIYYVLNITTYNFQVSEAKDGDPIQFALDYSSYLCNYHTLEVPITTTGTIINSKRRIRTWRIKDLRDMKGYVAGVFKPRIRDTYVRLKFKYLHGDNKRILMHDLNTYYTAPKETLGNM